MSPPRFLYLIFGVFALIGVGLFGGAAYWASLTRGFIARSAHGTGRVQKVDAQTSRDDQGDEHTSYTPTVEFVAPDGTPHVFTASHSTSKPYRIGQELPILFERAAPDHARLDQWFPLWGGPLVLGLVGLPFFLVGAIGLGVILKGRR